VDQHEDSKLVARELALVMAESHLRSGHDVVVPQSSGGRSSSSPSRQWRDAAVRFVEILIEDTCSAAGERFRLRREALLARGEPHPQADVADDAVEAVVAEAIERLTALAQQRSTVARIADADSIEVTYAHMLEAVHVVSRLKPGGRGQLYGISALVQWPPYLVVGGRDTAAPVGGGLSGDVAGVQGPVSR
jgi:hypothetical protein